MTDIWLPEMLFLPGEIRSVIPEEMAREFKSVFGSAAARTTKSVVYYFISEKPVPRVRGQSPIIYIGKTEGSLFGRYFRYSTHLASKKSGAFYRHIVENFGAIRIGYFVSIAPKDDERKHFEMYVAEHLEFPPKSKVG